MRSFPNLVSRDKVLWCIVLVWTGFVFHHYFSMGTAFDLSFLLTLFSTASRANLDKLAGNWFGFLGHLLSATAAFFVLWRLGRKFLNWIGLGEKSTVLRFCLEMALGIILANALWLGLGFNGLWFESLLWLAALALLGWALWDFSRSFLKFQKFPQVPRPGKFFVFLGLLGLLSLGLDILQGMTPDVYYDALVYHLSTLQFWLFHHGIADFYTNLYSYFPFGGELYFFNGFFIGGSEAAKILNAFSAGLCGLAAAGWVAEEAGWDKGLLAWAMVLTLPLVSAVVWTTQNDVLLAFFFILFISALLRWLSGAGNSWALAAGLLGGAALTVKYTAIVSIGIGLFTTLVFYKKSAADPKKRAGWARLILLMAGSITPWFLKNSVFTGNAFYPYLSSVFGGRTLPVENMKALLNDNEAALGNAFSLWTWASRVLATDLNKTIAPLLFAFVPLLFLSGKRKPVTWFLLVLSTLLLFFGFLISHQLRLLIPAFTVGFVAMMLALGDVERKGATFVWGGIAAFFGLLSVLSLGRLSVDYYQTQRMAFGEKTREEYLASVPQTASYYGLTRAVGKFLKPEEQVLVVGDARSLYYPRPFIANSVFDEQVLPKLALQKKNGEDIWRGLKEMGVDAIVFSDEEGKRLAGQYPSYAFEPASLERMKAFIRYQTVLYFDGLNGVYRPWPIPEAPGSPLPNLLLQSQPMEKPKSQ